MAGKVFGLLLTGGMLAGLFICVRILREEARQFTGAPLPPEEPRTVLVHPALDTDIDVPLPSVFDPLRNEFSERMPHQQATDYMHEFVTCSQCGETVIRREVAFHYEYTHPWVND